MRWIRLGHSIPAVAGLYQSNIVNSSFIIPLWRSYLELVVAASVTVFERRIDRVSWRQILDLFTGSHLAVAAQIDKYQKDSAELGGKETNLSVGILLKVPIKRVVVRV